MDELLKEMREIKELLKTKPEDTAPKLLYVKDLVKRYRINPNKATAFCKQYGINVGGWCIEEECCKKVFQTQGLNLLNLLK